MIKNDQWALIQLWTSEKEIILRGNEHYICTLLNACSIYHFINVSQVYKQIAKNRVTQIQFSGLLNIKFQVTTSLVENHFSSSSKQDFSSTSADFKPFDSTCFVQNFDEKMSNITIWLYFRVRIGYLFPPNAIYIYTIGMPCSRFGTQSLQKNIIK